MFSTPVRNLLVCFGCSKRSRSLNSLFFFGMWGMKTYENVWFKCLKGSTAVKYRTSRLEFSISSLIYCVFTCWLHWCYLIFGFFGAEAKRKIPTFKGPSDDSHPEKTTQFYNSFLRCSLETRPRFAAATIRWFFWSPVDGEAFPRLPMQCRTKIWCGVFFLSFCHPGLIWLVVSTPFEKYESNWESSPNRGENKKIFETTT